MQLFGSSQLSVKLILPPKAVVGPEVGMPIAALVRFGEKRKKIKVVTATVKIKTERNIFLLSQ